VEEVKNMLKQFNLLPVGEVNCHLNLMLVKMQKSHEFVTKAGMFLPTHAIGVTSPETFLPKLSLELIYQ
jgi:hypothetical protein